MTFLGVDGRGDGLGRAMMMMDWVEWSVNKMWREGYFVWLVCFFLGGMEMRGEGGEGEADGGGEGGGEGGDGDGDLREMGMEMGLGLGLEGRWGWRWR